MHFFFHFVAHSVTYTIDSVMHMHVVLLCKTVPSTCNDINTQNKNAIIVKSFEEI